MRWNIEDQNNVFTETSSTPWKDPGESNNKISLIDLTGRKKSFPTLANDDSASLNDLIGNVSEGFSQNGVGYGLAREETCIVNAAIMKSRYPHKGGKEFNKPIVVDIDLPVWID